MFSVTFWERTLGVEHNGLVILDPRVKQYSFQYWNQRGGGAFKCYCCRGREESVFFAGSQFQRKCKKNRLVSVQSRVPNSLIRKFCFLVTNGCKVMDKIRHLKSVTLPCIFWGPSLNYNHCFLIVSPKATCKYLALPLSCPIILN